MTDHSIRSDAVNGDNYRQHTKQGFSRCSSSTLFCNDNGTSVLASEMELHELNKRSSEILAVLLVKKFYRSEVKLSKLQRFGVATCWQRIFTEKCQSFSENYFW